MHISVYNEVFLYKATLFCYTILYTMHTLFLHSQVKNPYEVYRVMLAEYPVYWDETNRLWAIYSYKACTAMLHADDAHIPVINPGNKDGLNDHALLISEHLVRLSNGMAHAIARSVAMRLYEKMKPVATNHLVEKLLTTRGAPNETDWVNTVCKKLPVLAVLHSLGFSEEDAGVIARNIEILVTIMLPNKTPEQVKDINAISKEVYRLVESHLLSSRLYEPVIHKKSEQYKIEADQMLSLWTVNCIGLMIQSYDAGRGILSNALLPLLGSHHIQNISKEFLHKSITETLRYDPPVHNTRRVAINDIMLNNITIKKGDALLLVLAAANRDPLQFNQPNSYDIKRWNNNEHLTFGSGAHSCIARHWVVSLTADCLYFLFNRYTCIQLVQQEIQYEPLVNARLPKSLLISFS